MSINAPQLPLITNPGENPHSEGKGRPAANPSLVDVRRVLFKRKFLIISIVIIALAISIIYGKTRIPLYEATATAEIDPSRSQSMGLGGVLGGNFDESSTELQTDVVRSTGSRSSFELLANSASSIEGRFPMRSRVSACLSLMILSAQSNVSRFWGRSRVGSRSPLFLGRVRLGSRFDIPIQRLRGM
jgi:hypothetical protein